MKLTVKIPKIILPILFCIAGLSSLQAQTGSIHGRVITSDGQPAAGVTITVKNSRKTILSGDDGSFTLTKIDTGRQALIISYAELRSEEDVEE